MATIMHEGKEERMTRLTRRTVVQAGAVAVGGMAIDLLVHPAGERPDQTPAPSMALSVARIKVAGSRIRRRALCLVSKEPGFQAFYLVSTPGDEVTMISMFQDQKARKPSLGKP
jgi:hypothetical protein